MSKLNNNELKEINGGAVSSAIWAILGGIGILVVGIIDGYFNPIKCKQ